MSADREQPDTNDIDDAELCERLVNDIRDLVGPQFDGLERRFDGLDEKLHDINEIKGGLDAVGRGLGDVKKAVRILSGRPG